jgi:hypothetical protein
MVKLETVLKLAKEHGFPVQTKKVNIHMEKLCPKARAEVERKLAEAWEETRKRLEVKLRAMGVLPLYRVYRGEDGKKNVRVYREKKE